MDALKKFLQKKKTDKAFKSAGPGQKLTDHSGRPVSQQQQHGTTSSSKGRGTSSGGRPPQQQQPSSSAGSEAKGAAAAAALARLEKTRKPGDVDPDKLRATRQMQFIKEQALKELEAERQRDAQDKGNHKEEEQAEQVMTQGRHPEAMAVSGVYFTCPLIGPEILSKSEIEENIKAFLLEQPDEEMGVTSCLLIHSCNKPQEKVVNCVETLSKYLDNIISNPQEQKFRKIRCSNKVFQEKVNNCMGSAQFLKAAGFRKRMMKADPSASADEEFWVFQCEEEDDFVGQLTELRDMLRETTPILPELDRNVQVLMPAQVKTRMELPDAFFNLTLDEVKREQLQKTEHVEKELTLRTKAMRERDELREQRLYRYGIMRIRFPDGFTLQGTFKAHERLSNLYDFVLDNLVEEVKFELVRFGGESLTNMDATLAEMKLPPSSILNFKVDSAPAPLATGEISYLKPEVLALVR